MPREPVKPGRELTASAKVLRCRHAWSVWGCGRTEGGVGRDEGSLGIEAQPA